MKRKKNKKNKKNNRIQEQYQEEKPVVLLGILTPSHFYFPHGYVISLVTMLTYSHAVNAVKGVNVSYQGGPRTSSNRNKIVQKALQPGMCNYVLMIDSDMTFERDALEKMIETAEAYPNSVITGMGCIGKPPFRPAVFQWPEIPSKQPTHVEYWEDEPFKVEACGSFGTLIPVHILEALGPDCYDHIADYYDSGPDVESRELRHDLAFSKRVTEAGYNIVCNPKIVFGHLRTYPVTPDDWIQNRDFGKPKPIE